MKTKTPTWRLEDREKWTGQQDLRRGKKENIHCKPGNDSTTPSQRSRAKNQLCGFLRDFYGFSMSFHGFLWISWMSMDLSWIFLWIFPGVLLVFHGFLLIFRSFLQTKHTSPDPIPLWNGMKTRSVVPRNPLKDPSTGLVRNLDRAGAQKGVLLASHKERPAGKGPRGKAGRPIWGCHGIYHTLW